ncbi:MAG: ribokinase [Lachnospiraceae bacterium]|nr:ribokinase [Lachnospiraceae bacterium]
MKKTILVAGSLNMDMVMEMARMPAVGETILGDTLSYVPGGKGANQACTVAKLGGRAVMLGCVGRDDFGESLRGNLAAAGVEVSKLKTGESSTGAASIYVDGAGNNSIVVIRGANEECDISYIDQNDSLLRQCSYVMLQMEIPYETIFYVIKKAKEYGKVVILNPAPAPGPGAIPEEIYKKIDFITPNETELKTLTGVPDCGRESLEKGAGLLLEKGVGNVMVTLGEQGAVLVNAQGSMYFPAMRTMAVDTTAAGDCFNGAFVTALADDMAVPEAIRFANAAASVAVSRKGAQSSIPSAEEVQRVLAEAKHNDDNKVTV